jgi:hypothetical protein
MGAVTVTGFVVQGLFVTRFIDKKRKEDSGELERLKVQLAAGAAQKLEECKLALAEQQKKRESRHDALRLVEDLSFNSEEAARDLCKFSEIETGEERVRIVTKALQAMSPFFEMLAKADRKHPLTKEDRAEARVTQQRLVEMLLLMDFDRSDTAYRDVLKNAYTLVAHSARSFQAYVDNVVGG